CLAHRIVVGSVLWIAGSLLAAQAPVLAGQKFPNSPSRADRPAMQSSLSFIESELRHQLDLNPESAPLLLQLGQVLLRENKPKESLDMYTRAARLQKPNAAQVRLVAMDYALLKLYNDAIQWLQIAHSMDPDDVDVMYDMGRCFYTQSRFHEAEQMYLKV